MREVLAQIHDLIGEFEQGEQNEHTVATVRALHTMFVRLATAQDARTLSQMLKDQRFNLKCTDLQTMLGGEWGFQFKYTGNRHMIISHPLLPGRQLTVNCHFKGKQGQYNPSEINEIIRMVAEVEQLKAQQKQEQSTEEQARQQALTSPDGWKYFQDQERRKRFSANHA